jgi:hypothetical protein
VDKAAAIEQRILPQIEELLADAERQLIAEIRHHALRPSLERGARMVRHIQLLLVRCKLLAAPNDRRLVASKTMWEAMLPDDIIGAYRART